MQNWYVKLHDPLCLLSGSGPERTHSKRLRFCLFLLRMPLVTQLKNFEAKFKLKWLFFGFSTGKAQINRTYVHNEIDISSSKNHYVFDIDSVNDVRSFDSGFRVKITRIEESVSTKWFIWFGSGSEVANSNAELKFSFLIRCYVSPVRK